MKKREFKNYTIEERLEYHSSKILELETEIENRRMRIAELEALQNTKIWNKGLKKIASDNKKKAR